MTTKTQKHLPAQAGKSTKTTFISHSEEETFELAKKIALGLIGGETFCLIGDLGAGKTAFTKGLAAGLGVDKIITSPTFVLMKNYESQKHKNTKTQKPLMLVHVDAYRLSDSEELGAIGINDYINDANCVTVIEWADRVYPVKLLKKYLDLKNNKDEFVKNLTIEELEIFNRVKDIWPKDAIEINFKTLDGDKREIEIKK